LKILVFNLILKKRSGKQSAKRLSKTERYIKNKDLKNKMKKYLILWIIALVFSVGLVVAGKPDTNLVPATNTKADISLTIPKHAVEVAPGVFSLGTAADVDGREVEGFAIFEKREFAKPGAVCGNGICEPGENANKCAADCSGGSTTSSCFSYLANGAKWKTLESWFVNPSNTQGINADYVLSNVVDDIQKWEDVSVNILGGGSSTAESLVADTSSPDGLNEVYFGDVSNSGAIAVTIVWGIFRGPPSQRELVEWDQVYDQVDFSWSTAGEVGKMDFENIATHEIGHSVGMGHPSSECTEETMYAYADFGETKKRTLEAGDITGVKGLYN